MLINLEGPPLKSLLCEMGGASDAGQPRGTTPKVSQLFASSSETFLCQNVSR